ncbi:MAG: GNAT family N-acetyltransferase [Candidatus Saccharibacteria bacterium]|nr:GNAT family N-acetyltransferase [Candidatus Saccharibacteria bacterium]
MDITTRFATMDDESWILEQSAEFSKTYPTKLNLADNLPYMKLLFKNLIQEHVLIIAEMGSTRMGFIAGMKAPHHFNPDLKVLSELLWWVCPEFRGSRAGSALLEDFIAIGKDTCDWITFTIEEQTPISDKSLIKRGFKPTEQSYLLEVR